MDLQAEAAGALPGEVPCAVVAPEDATHWMVIKHTGENEGVGVIPWSALAKDRYRRSNPALQAVELVDKHGYLTTEMKAELPNIARALVVTLADAVVGYTVATGPHVDVLMIDELFHRQGLGTLLLARIEERLFREHTALELENFHDNDQANAFYRKHGWQITGAHRDEQYGVEMVTLRKEAS